jgi:Fe-S-cluster containining protein
MYNQERKIVVDEGYADLEWVSFHRNLIVSRQGRYYTIEINSGMDATLIWNDLKGCWFLHVKDKCINLLPDNRCSIYDRRPNICRITKCPVFSPDEEIKWYGRHGLLKEKVIL